MTERLSEFRPRTTTRDLVEQSIARGEDMATTIRKTGCRVEDVVGAHVRMAAAIEGDNAPELVPVAAPRPAVCGTDAGARRHYRLAERPCPACLRAARWAASDRAAKRRAS